MDNRRDFIKKASLLSGGAGFLNMLPPAIQKALAIDPATGSTFMDAEHVVFLMQENRSFDHTYGTLRGVRGFNDPRAITLPNKNLVWLQTNEKGETYAPFRFNIKDSKITWMHSLPHGWSDQVDARNQGKYDKWLDSKGSDHYPGMPLTMGYYNREDIPFYYSLADAFTVCDQNFCSSLTGTTPNRLYFWTGTIREKPHESSIANVWNSDADYETMVSWASFPERLEDQNISWKVYQNELSVGVGFSGEEDAWLANFGDNPLEYFTQYQVKLSAAFIANLPKAAIQLKEEIKKAEAQLLTLEAGSKEAEELKNRKSSLLKYLSNNLEDQKVYTGEKYDQLSQKEKNIHEKAFSTNINDPNYHQITTLQYEDKDVVREVNVPKGDVLQEFRDDVQQGKLPTVSWIVAPENFSDHPSSAWYGAWYISEVMDILTKNPEVWKKTIFILTYDENDGYFDHVPPFVPPHPHKEGTGLTSAGIDTSVEYVSNINQQSSPERARESSIGLGYRVPLVIASPWTRGGWVNSEVFDHTSSIQFLEKFLSAKFGKKIQEPNISAWRRTVCGDLTSAFRPYNGEKIPNPAFVQKDKFIESIHKAQFKKEPDNYKSLSVAEIDVINKNPRKSSWMPSQEKGIREACSLPYELYSDGQLNADKTAFEITLKASNEFFGNKSAGSPFHIYAPGQFRNEAVATWAYAVKAGDRLKDTWSLNDFENNQYHLCVYGPNGFFREFSGSKNDPQVEIINTYERSLLNSKQLSGNIVVQFNNTGSRLLEVQIKDNSYKSPNRSLSLQSKKTKVTLRLTLEKSFGWYDFTIRVKGYPEFSKRYAGRVETGKPGKSDPAMGMLV
ncbi:MAG: phospholipase C, phosphocholine-specific [Saprospiraceae bacterium]